MLPGCRHEDLLVSHLTKDLLALDRDDLLEDLQALGLFYGGSTQGQSREAGALGIATFLLFLNVAFHGPGSWCRGPLALIPRVLFLEWILQSVLTGLGRLSFAA